jgi:hypothetical protein
MRTGQKKFETTGFFNFRQLQEGSSQPIKGLSPQAANESKVNAHWPKIETTGFFNISQLQVGSSQPIKGLSPQAAIESKVNAHWFSNLANTVTAGFFTPRKGHHRQPVRSQVKEHWSRQ